MRPCLRSLLLFAAAACAAAPLPDPVAALALAEESLQRGDHDSAYDLLLAIVRDGLPRNERERHKLALARALFGCGDGWKAYKEIKTFPDEFPFSMLLPKAEELEFTIGRTLLESDGGFLFFSSDADDGQTVLEHFIVRYAASNRLRPDALRLLGEKAHGEKDYGLARSRYMDLLQNHPDSEWSTLARYRIAMCQFEGLAGADYDLSEMLTAHNELRDFLAAAPENPQMVAQAQAAMTRTREWLGEKHLTIAAFYRRIGVGYGEAVHLRIAAQDYPDTTAGKQAIALLPAAGRRP